MNKAIKTNILLFIIFLLVSCNNIYNDGFTYKWSAQHNGWLVTSGDPNIKNLIIPEKLVNNRDYVIGVAANAFRESTIETIKFPSHTVFIGKSAFQDCRRLTSNITLPPSLEIIESKAFYNININNVVIPSTIKAIGSKAFNKFGDTYDISLNVKKNDGSYDDLYNNLPDNWAKDYKGNYDRLTYTGGSDTVNGDKVKNLQVIRIPETRDGIPVETVKANSFDGRMTDEYGKSTYKRIKEIYLGKNIKTIEENAFKDLPYLEKLSLNEGLERIEDGGFSNQSWQESPIIKVENKQLPSTIKYLGSGAFAYASLDIKDLRLPSIEYLGGGIFNNLTSNKNQHQFETITFGPNLKVMKPGAGFHGTPNLHTITFDPSSPLDEVNGFSNCKKLETVTLPNNLKSIGDSAFASCDGLKKLKLPDSIVEIKSSAFNSSPNLTDVNLPVNLKIIGNSAFAGTGLTTVSFPENLEKIGSGAFKDSKLAGIITIPAKVNEISGYAFANTDISEIKFLGDKVSIIGANTFEGCSKLEKFNFTHVEYIQPNAFKDSGLKGSIVLPPLRRIGSSAFENTNIEEIKITYGPNLDKIPSKAFKNCKKLKKVELNQNRIESNAFEGCELLSDINVNKVRYFNEDIFKGCTALKTITLGYSINYINSNAFANSSINKIIVPNTTIKKKVEATTLPTGCVVEVAP